MKKIGIIVGIVVLALLLSKARDRAVRAVDMTHRTDAVERAKNISLLDEKRELDVMANSAPGPGSAEESAMDRSPFHFLALSPSGRYLSITGPLTFNARDTVRLVLEIHPALVEDDMPDPTIKPGEPNRPDLRIANTAFEVLADEDGKARPVPFRSYCSLAPEPSDIAVNLELGGSHDALDAAAKRIHEQELARTISPADARRQLEALYKDYAPNKRGSYQIRAVYRHGRLATAPITLIITD